jgi:glycosidase
MTMSEPNRREMEFHISRQARERYGLDDALFTLRGGVVLANFHAARIFAQRMNARRDLARFPERAVRAGQINAMGLIDEILHLVIEMYRREKSPHSMANAVRRLSNELGGASVDATLRRFADEFPPLAVYRREISVDDYIEGSTGGVPNREVLLEELLMLHLANANPACSPFGELFDDSALRRDTAYVRLAAGLHDHFELEPFFGPANQNLVDMLRSPALVVPHSLPGQLEYIREHWGFLLGRLLYRLLGSLDLISEEERARFGVGGGPGAGQAPVLEFGGLAVEPERFSPDRDWMPRLVLIAKNAYVWLDQLSKRHGRTLGRLDEIPDAELDTLARWGFTGLWLIGVWERSPASQRIKQLCGNPEAVASAYSLADYRIADDLGGEAAYNQLKERAWRRGIRMATDMVPNHMGIDSRWVCDHPDWFVSLEQSPFPVYSFSGPDLSRDERVGIFLEDHYYSRTDASVVFKRVDRWTGAERYIYHGNDGTSMPWNDTAQLNYLLPEVREAVIQTILHVARLSPIIRFDAAMTLAKKHYQRLWFPEPGSGGAIPTRAGLGLTREQFDAAIPVEFWREVVDRAAAEAPDTLLLAEAFWLMEGYFVRTLGMHRVYNSAFMNMLRDEDNAKYRQVMKNTLEFDPEVLKRYVNFMNNPDERTAVDQFGKGDKYFGIATMMATLPGLPMFGHGQVEGLGEKYGMEYRRAYWDEQPDAHLIWRHEQELFPLHHRRHLFAGVERFRLYDFFTPDGSVNEDVFAYSNRAGDERALVIYHNKWAETRGWVKTSAAWAVKHGDERELKQSTLAEGLGLETGERAYSIFRDLASGLEYLRASREIAEQGLFVELGAYRRHVFTDFRQVHDQQGQYANLVAYLGGRGVPSVDEALRETFLQPLHRAYGELVDPELLRRMAGTAGGDGEAMAPVLAEVEARALRVLGEVRRVAGGDGDERRAAAEVVRTAAAVLRLAGGGGLPAGLPGAAREALARRLAALLADDPLATPTLLVWALTRSLGAAASASDAAQRSRSGVDEWLLTRVLDRTFRDLGADEGAASQAIALVKVLTAHQGWHEDVAAGAELSARRLEVWLTDDEVRLLLQVNRHRDVLWFNKEASEHLLDCLLAVAATSIAAAEAPAPAAAARLAACAAIAEKLREAAESSGFQLERLLALAAATPQRPPGPAADTGPAQR